MNRLVDKYTSDNCVIHNCEETTACSHCGLCQKHHDEKVFEETGERK